MHPAITLAHMTTLAIVHATALIGQHGATTVVGASQPSGPVNNIGDIFNKIKAAADWILTYIPATGVALSALAMALGFLMFPVSAVFPAVRRAASPMIWYAFIGLVGSLVASPICTSIKGWFS